MERENYGEVGDFMRKTEPVSMDDVPVRDGRDFVQSARPSTGVDKRPSGMSRQLGYQPITKRG